MPRNAAGKISKFLFWVIKWVCLSKSKELCTLNKSTTIANVQWPQIWTGLLGAALASIWWHKLYAKCTRAANLLATHMAREATLASAIRSWCDLTHAWFWIHFWLLHIKPFITKFSPAPHSDLQSQAGRFQTHLRRLCPSQWHLVFTEFSYLSGGE